MAIFLPVGDITLYPEKKQVFSGDEEIFLTAKEYHLLELFMANQDQVLTKENILERIWGIDGEFVEENTLSVTISRLKKSWAVSSYISEMFSAWATEWGNKAMDIAVWIAFVIGIITGGSIIYIRQRKLRMEELRKAAAMTEDILQAADSVPLLRAMSYCLLG